MTRTAVLCLAGLILIGLASPAAARGRQSKNPALATLWGEYEDIRKVNDVSENRRRTAIARELGSIGSEDAVRRLLQIFEQDPHLKPRLAAMEALCATGDAKIVNRVVKRAAGEKGYLRYWIGDALAGASNPEIGPWLVAKSKLLTSRRTRECAIEALGRLRVAEAREPLLGLRRSARSKPDLDYEILRALGRIGGEGVKEALLAAAADEDFRRRLAAAETLLRVAADEAVLGAVRALLADEDGVVREVAARAVGVAKVADLVPELLPLLEDERLRVRPAAREALRSIGATDLGYDRAAWTDWWKRRQAGGRAGPGGTVARAEDDRIMSNGVLFLVDISKSMGWQAPGVTRLSVAQRKTVALLRRLDERAVFNVIAVTGRAQPWKKARGKRGGEVSATKRNVEEAIAWVEGLTCAVHTNYWDVLEEALTRHPEIDTIYLVTDGAIALGGYVPHEEILPRFRCLNRFRRVVVHTSFVMWGPRLSWAEKYEDPDEQAAFLRALAEQTGGTFEEQRYPPAR